MAADLFGDAIRELVRASGQPASERPALTIVKAV